MEQLTIMNQEVRQNAGLYSLNDIHRLSGGEQKHKPVHFMGRQQTIELIDEIEKVGISTFKTSKGRNGGTFACKQIVVAYAAWLNPKIHLAVLNAFLEKQEPKIEQPAQQKGEVVMDYTDSMIMEVHGGVQFFRPFEPGRYLSGEDMAFFELALSMAEHQTRDMKQRLKAQREEILRNSRIRHLN